MQGKALRTATLLAAGVILLLQALRDRRKQKKASAGT